MKNKKIVVTKELRRILESFAEANERMDEAEKNGDDDKAFDIFTE